MDCSVLLVNSCTTKGLLKVFLSAIAFLLVLFTLHNALKPLKSDILSVSSHFTVILDCGSTGTRVSVHEWLRNSTSNYELPVLLRSLPDEIHNGNLSKIGCEYHCMQTIPGLHKLVHNPLGLHSVLEPLLLWAAHHIPRQKHKETPIFVLATAGLRQMTHVDAAWVLRNIQTVLKKHSFLCQKNAIRVLTGQEESYYGWVALNYKMNKLGRFVEGPTLGILDLGGSSLQVVMEVDQSTKSAHVFTSNIDSVEHRLLSYSFPALGLNAAFDRSIVLLSEGKMNKPGVKKGSELRHPCLNLGFEQNYTCNGCRTMSNLTHWEDVDIEYPITFVLVGDPDWDMCRKLARAVAIFANGSHLLQLPDDTTCKEQSSSTSIGKELLNQTVRSDASIYFHALSGFFAMSHMLNLDYKVKINQLLLKGEHICSKLWIDLKSMYENGYYVEQLCFRAPFLAVLLEDAFCLGDVNITYGPGDVSWTLGAALVEGGYLWSSKGKLLMKGNFGSKTAFLSAIIIFIPLAVCAILAMIYRKTSLLPTWALLKTRKRESSIVSLPISILPKKQRHK